MSERPSEVTEFHTRLLRITLEVDACATYWSHVNPDLSHADRAIQADVERWFGDRSTARVRKLVDEISSRFDPFPEAIEVLRKWTNMPDATRRLICHWHVQLTDAVYRDFTGNMMPQLHTQQGALLTRELVAQWIEKVSPGRWADSTKLKYSGNLVTTAAEAGLISQPAQGRVPQIPDVSDDALAYLLHLLKGIDIAGSLTDNPYLRSVGMHGTRLETAIARLAGKPDAGSFDLTWMAASLGEWAARRV